MMNSPHDQDEVLFLRRIQENKGILFKICHSYCRNAGDREDLAQEMIYQLWKSGHQFNADHKFSTWMYRIALNVAISFYRREQRAGVRLSLGGDLHLLDLEDRPDGSAEVEEKIDLLQRWIQDLGDLDKALMILYLEEKSYREIAEILGITETNVATKLSRIKLGLRKRFSQTNELI
jgi:RNA polymerase sigma factor (sigma-70 family)